MALDIAAFNSAFGDLRYRQRTEQNFDVAAAQNELRALITDEPEGENRAWALRLIDKLAEPLPPPRQWSALYHEAVAIQAEAGAAAGTVEQRIAAIEDARHRIWAIADRASKDEAAHIRAITRPMEHFEDELRNPSFPPQSNELE